MSLNHVTASELESVNIKEHMGNNGADESVSDSPRFMNRQMRSVLFVIPSSNVRCVSVNVTLCTWSILRWNSNDLSGDANVAIRSPVLGDNDIAMVLSG